MKGVRRVIASNGVPYPQMRSIGSHSTSGREKHANKERTGIYFILFSPFLPYSFNHSDLFESMVRPMNLPIVKLPPSSHLLHASCSVVHLPCLHHLNKSCGTFFIKKNSWEVTGE